MWAELVQVGKAFGAGEFDSKALLHNLADNDYGRPLDELRDLFWNSPRMPLLPGGDIDLQRAIFEAVSAGQLRLVGDDDTEREITRSSDIGVGSPSLRLAGPKVAESHSDELKTYQDSEQGGQDDEERGSGRQTDGDQVQLAFTINSSLTDSTRRDAIWKMLHDLATRVDDQYATHIQLVVKVVLPKSESEPLTERAKEAGGSPSSTPVS